MEEPLSDTTRIDTSRWEALPEPGKEVLGILVGGGPAPGINGVISALTIEAIRRGCRVLGIEGGYSGLVRGRTDRVHELTLDDVSRIHLAGGSILGTSRANPTGDPEDLNRVVETLKKLGVTLLASIGGDDTAFSSASVLKASGDSIRVAHVPKTIDNDLPLPGDMPTFGYQTARHEGVRVLRHLAVDAQTTGRWYMAVTMGRKAGHLALGIGKAAGATLTLIPEEFRAPLPLRVLGDQIETTILKRRAMGRNHGTLVLAEGLIEKLDPEDVSGLKEAGHDEHGHLQLAEIRLGEIVRREVVDRFKARGDSLGIVTKDIGYELRCADPIPFDMEYTRDLGFGTALFLLSGGTGALMSIQRRNLVPIPFDEILDPETGRTAVRLVDLESQSHVIAREYMIRLEATDIEMEEAANKLAKEAGLSVDEFRKRFRYLVEPNPYRVPIPRAIDIRFP